MAFYRPNEQLYVSAPAAYLPEREMTNAGLIEWMGARVKPEWIARRTGIESRWWASDDEAVSDLAVKAAEALFARLPDRRGAVRQLVLATSSGDYPTPPTSPLVQHRLGLREAGCVDLGAACAGFVTGLYAAAVHCGATAETQLLAAAEIRSRFLDRRDLATAVLFGDGAAACLVSRDRRDGEFAFVAGELLSDGSVADLVCLAAGGSRLPCHEARDLEGPQYLRMKDGPRLFLLAAQGMCAAAQSLLARLGMPAGAVDWLVPHQANLHLVRETARLLGFPPERVVETVQHYGNTSGSSVGLALARLCGDGRLSEGQHVLLVSAGGGGVAATTLLRKVDGNVD